MKERSIGDLVDELPPAVVKEDILNIIRALGDSGDKTLNKKLKEQAIYKLSSFLEEVIRLESTEKN